MPRAIPKSKYSMPAAERRRWSTSRPMLFGCRGGRRCGVCRRGAADRDFRSAPESCCDAWRGPKAAGPRDGHRLHRGQRAGRGCGGPRHPALRPRRQVPQQHRQKQSGERPADPQWRGGFRRGLRNGTIYAANPGKHRVERYTPAGELLGHIGRFDGNDPAGFTGCCNPDERGRRRRASTPPKRPARASRPTISSGKLLAVIAPMNNALFDPNCKNMNIAVSIRGPRLRRRYREAAHSDF